MGVKFFTSAFCILYCCISAIALDHIGIEVSETKVKQPSYDWITLAFVNQAPEDIQLLHGFIAIESTGINVNTGDIIDAPVIISDNILAIFDDQKQLLSVTNQLNLPSGRTKSTNFIAESLSALYGTSSAEKYKVEGTVTIELDYYLKNTFFTLEKTIPLSLIFDSHIADNEPQHWSKLNTLLEEPSSDIAHAYLLEKLLYLFSTEEKAAIPFEKVFDSFLKRNSHADGKYILLDFIDTYYPDEMLIQNYFLSAILDKKYEAIDDLNYVYNIWSEEYAVLLLALIKDASINLSIKSQIASILNRQLKHSPEEAFLSKIPKILEKDYAFIFDQEPNDLIFHDQRSWAALAQIIGLTGNRSNIDLLLPYLSSSKEVFDNSVEEYQAQNDYPKASTIQEITLETIFKLEELDIHMVYYSAGYLATDDYYKNLSSITAIRTQLIADYIEKYKK